MLNYSIERKTDVENLLLCDRDGNVPIDFDNKDLITNN